MRIPFIIVLTFCALAGTGCNGPGQDGDVDSGCAIRPVGALTAVWPSEQNPEPVKLPGTACGDGTFIRRVKLARGQAAGTFAVFYSTCCSLGCDPPPGCENAIMAQAYSLGSGGPEVLCSGESFVVKGDNSRQYMDFNVVRRDDPPHDNYYLAYTTVPEPPPPSEQHDVRAARLRFGFNQDACEFEVIEDRSIKVLDDNDCEKGGEPWFLDRGDGMLFAEWWQETGSGLDHCGDPEENTCDPQQRECCDYGTGDVGLSFRVLEYEGLHEAEDAGRPRLLDGEPYTPQHRRLFMDPGIYHPYTRLFHGVHRPGGYYICHNASADGRGAQCYNETDQGARVNIFCARYEEDLDHRPHYDPQCGVDVIDAVGLDELFLQGVTVLPGGGGGDPLMVLYSYDSDGSLGGKDDRGFDELRLTDLAGTHLHVFPPGEEYKWGPSEDGVIWNDDVLGTVAIVIAVRQDVRCPYVQVVSLK